MENANNLSEFFKNPVYDTFGDSYFSQKHKWKIYLSKRMKKKD